MKKHLIVLLAGLTLVVGCQDKSAKIGEQPVPEALKATESTAAGFNGKVVQTIDVEPYSYVQVDTGEKKVWAATPHFQGKVGDSVIVPPGLAMENFHSNTLKRDFDLVYFVGAIKTTADRLDTGQQPQMSFDHASLSGQTGESRVDVRGISRAEDGKTVAEVFGARQDLAGKQVLVRGKVVKFLPNIMGKNWLHLQDGSGGEGTNDLTVTTGSAVKVGDLVLVNGVVSVDRDFGFGYRYDVILEDAEVTVE